MLGSAVMLRCWRPRPNRLTPSTVDRGVLRLQQSRGSRTCRGSRVRLRRLGGDLAHRLQAVRVSRSTCTIDSVPVSTRTSLDNACISSERQRWACPTSCASFPLHHLCCCKDFLITALHSAYDNPSPALPCLERRT